MNKEQIENVIQDAFTVFKGSDRGAMVLACRQLFETYYTPLEASHRELIDVISGKIAHPNRVEEILSNAKKLL